MVFSLIVLATMIIGFGLLFFFVNKKMNELQSSRGMEEMVSKVFGMTSNQIAEQSKRILSGEKEIIQTDLANKQHAIEQLVKNLQLEIGERQKEIRALEQDRNKSFAAVREAIEQHQEITKDLKTTTETLSKVLSNNQVRGSWGERIIEDLLQSSGFIEGIHYLKQHNLGSTTDRPDITLLLPNKRVVPIDVKFPYAEMQKFSVADTKALQDAHKKQFAIDVRQKIKKVALYIQPEQDTLDYAILFVPNEMIFSFINQNFPEIITEAIEHRVMIASPFTFLIVARTIMESYRNFMMESNLRTIVKHIGEFGKEWERFIGEFDKFGDSISKMEQAYHQIRDTRHKQLTTKMNKIEDLKKQENLPAPTKA